MDLKESQILGEQVNNHWYYRSKLAAIRAYTKGVSKRSLLDVGAGSGFFSRALLADKDTVRAVCIDPSYPEEADDISHGKPILFRRSALDPNADLVLLIDVLEHVESDVELLRHYANPALDGTHFLLSVPAFSLLWSDHDRFLGHYRRYTCRELCAVARAANLSVIRHSYYFGFVLPLAVMTRLTEKLIRLRQPTVPASQLRAHHPIINYALYNICRAELPILPFNRIAGLSAFCLARKNT